MSNVSGEVYVLINMDNYGLELCVSSMGVDDVIGVYIYIGWIGINGDVLVVFE